MARAYLDAIAPVRPLVPGEVQTHEGGIAFAADRWTRLRRFLILGSEGSFYQAGQELTIENVGVVRECIADDLPRTLETITSVSDSGVAPKNEPAILALALCAIHAPADRKHGVYLSLPMVCRTGTHLLHFAAYREALGAGWGKGMRKAIGHWFTERPASSTAYQVTKYANRDGWTMRDLLRLSHPIMPSADHEAVVRFLLGKDAWDDATTNRELIDYLRAVTFTKTEDADPEAVATLITLHDLPREVINSRHLNDVRVWDALLAKMPMTAMIRNLAKMTAIGMISMGSMAESKIVRELLDMERIKRARVHPIQLLSALKIYERGHGERGKMTWTPSKRIVTALDEAFYLAFGNVPTTGKRIRLALDVSSSMRGNPVAGMNHLDARNASAAFALVTAAVEPDAHFVAYSHELVPVAIRPTMRLDEVLRITDAIPFGGTYCTLPIKDAIQKRLEIDAFVSYTDSETWNGGYRHTWNRTYETQPSGATASEALRMYRQLTGIPARHAVQAFCANRFTIADPADPGQLDIAGLDAGAPQILAEFIGGAL